MRSAAVPGRSNKRQRDGLEFARSISTGAVPSLRVTSLFWKPPGVSALLRPGTGALRNRRKQTLKTRP